MASFHLSLSLMLLQQLREWSKYKTLIFIIIIIIIYLIIYFKSVPLESKYGDFASVVNPKEKKKEKEEGEEKGFFRKYVKIK